MTDIEQLARETRSSIELKLNAKGEYAWDIKVFFNQDDPVAKGEAIADINFIDQMLRQEYLR